MSRDNGAIARYVEAKHEILKCNKRVGIDDDTFAALSASASQALCKGDAHWLASEVWTSKVVDYCKRFLGDRFRQPAAS